MKNQRTSTTYRVTPQMLHAGAAALLQIRAAGDHTPETVCLAVFYAMLDATDSTPGADLRKSFAWSIHDSTVEIHNGKTIRGVMTARPPLARPLESYAGFTLGAYEWWGFHLRYRKHCFKLRDSDRDWIWLTEPDWNAANFEERLKAGNFRADVLLCFQHTKYGFIARS
jgi:hypothetical protein